MALLLLVVNFLWLIAIRVYMLLLLLLLLLFLPVSTTLTTSTSRWPPAGSLAQISRRHQSIRAAAARLRDELHVRAVLVQHQLQLLRQ